MNTSHFTNDAEKSTEKAQDLFGIRALYDLVAQLQPELLSATVESKHILNLLYLWFFRDDNAAAAAFKNSVSEALYECAEGLKMYADEQGLNNLDVHLTGKKNRLLDRLREKDTVHEQASEQVHIKMPAVSDFVPSKNPFMFAF